MTDRPILFSAPMVRALLDSRKTQTRRLCKDQPPPGVTIIRKTIRPFGKEPYHAFERRTKFGNFGGEVPVKISRGDRLWVKETHARVGDNGDDHMACPDLTRLVYYRADDVQPELSRWRPSIFMRRQDSRITLIVTDVRVERLQDISEADAIAEGIERHHSGWMPYSTAFYEADGVTPANYHVDPRESYRSLWNKINGFGAWEANPWIAAYTFTVIKQNIDQIEREAA
ncbi:hypothetical protein [Sinorhizobium meliloti]|uniref:hypothetical protein n=1 Tax=Rhizobium meliloti TaxID=382 RepID=UPI000FD9314F|nr:hypothetical protein [Sinorhizobium meliloti]RVQ09817.1 hypothetical protein CN096_19205 [Sinorhizobium meliloti]